MNDNPIPVLYRELADWWPVLSSPTDYAEEAAIYYKAIIDSHSYTPHTLLELGSGGGNNASHLKKHLKMTLVDLSPGMLRVSQNLNPECEHILGDMRTVRLNRLFDVVFIHDAIVYMQTEDELRQAIETAYVHCVSGGVALFAPDHTRENFRESTDHGGHDQGKRRLRYLEWTYDPDPDDSTYVSDMVYLFHEGATAPRCILDRHICGLFSQENWIRLMDRVGFEARVLQFEHSEIEPDTSVFFLGIK